MLRHIAHAMELPYARSPCRGLLVTCSSGHYLKGLLFERTGRRTDAYLWGIVFPWFHPSLHLLLDFSKRLDGSFEGTESDIVRQAVTSIAETPGLRQDLVRPLSPAAFVEQHKYVVNSFERKSVGIVFDMAASAALDQRSDIAAPLLKHLGTRTFRESEHPARDAAAALLDALQTGGDIEFCWQHFTAANRARYLPRAAATLVKRG